MESPDVNFWDEMRLSAKPLLIGLNLIGGTIVLAVSPLVAPAQQLRQTAIGLVVILLTVVAWQLEKRNAVLSGWMAVLLTIALVYLGCLRAGSVVLLTLLALPAGLAYTILGGVGAFVTASVSTALIIAYTVLQIPTHTPAASTVALASLWGIVGLLRLTYGRVSRVLAWAWEYYERALQIENDARNLRAEVQQALGDLANANRQLVLANERIGALRAIAESAQRAKTMFVANVSHEFRTPLNMIIGLVDLMVHAPGFYDVILSPKMREDLEVVYRNCQHLSKMINDVLDLTRVEAGSLSLHRDWTDLAEIIEDSITAVRPLCERKGLTLTVRVPEDMPRIHCDRTRIQQVILNLISNAARFTQQGSVSIEVQVRAHDVLVSVSDTGPGIRQEDLERIFEPFCQGFSEPWCQRQGSGLGLSISRQFVRLHGGRMWVKSEVGVGTTFYFTLPLSTELKPVVRPGHQTRPDWVWRESAFRTGRHMRAHELTRPRVVVYDEVGSLCTLVSHYLGDAECIGITDLADLGELLRSGPAHVLLANAPSSSLVLTLAEELRKLAPGTPIVVCAVPPPTRAASDAGALGYLVKPVTRTMLAGVLHSLRAQGRMIRRAVVVDDDPDVLRLFSRMLRLCDPALEIATVQSAREALDTIRQSVPDLLLLDIVMPEMDGWQILRAMKEEGLAEHVATYFISAQDPADQLPVSPFVAIALDDGLSVGRIVRCSLSLARQFLKPETIPDQVSERIAEL